MPIQNGIASLPFRSDALHCKNFEPAHSLVDHLFYGSCIWSGAVDVFTDPKCCVT